MPKRTGSRKAGNLEIDGSPCLQSRWSRFSSEMTTKTGGRKLFRELVLNNYVSFSLTTPHTHRALIRKIAKRCRQAVPIESLPDNLNRRFNSRGRVVVGFPGDYFDQIARNYDRMWWWFSERGLNVKSIVNTGVGISRFDELAGRLMFEARPQRLSNGRLPPTVYKETAVILDNAHFKPLDYLTGKFRKRLADWNQKNPTRAIHTFEGLLKSKLWLPRRGILKRLYRAESVWAKLTKLSAG